nr:hypothetical protein [uncultured Pseudomonas sp.]
MTENLTQPGNPRYTAHALPAADEPTRNQTSEESGMQKDRHSTHSTTALLCKETSVATLETNSLCCEAAGIIASPSSTTETLIPHEKLREAATPNATLIAQNRPPAQPVLGYTHPDSNSESPGQAAVDEIQIDERIEFEKEFPVPEGLQYRAQRGTYITTPGAKTSDSFTREHYAYRSGFAAWMRRGWTHVGHVQRLEQANAGPRDQLDSTAQHRQPRGHFPLEEA